ncbi:hypothetical protein [Manganibacter manganicus]|nr:hypothetical protein [Pseudaminobacter manganicus]
MAGPTSSTGAGRFRPIDALDADFESVPKPRPDIQPPRLPSAPALSGMDMLCQEKAVSPSWQARRGAPIFWSAGLGVILVAFWVAGGHAFIRSLFPVADARAANALNLSVVTSRVDVSGEKPMLLIDGEAGNNGNRAAPLPPIDISVKDNVGATIRYKLGTAGRTLKPGESFAFSSRLEAPRNGVESVSVTFAE